MPTSFRHVPGVPAPMHAQRVDSPALGAVNVDGNPNNNRLPYDNRFEIANPDFTYANGNSFSKLQNWGVAGTLDFTVSPDVHLKSVTAYRRLHWRSGMDGDGSPLSIFELSFDMPQHEFSQELQLTGKAIGGRLDFALGAYYFQEGGHSAPALEFLSPIKGPALEQITVEVGSGIRSAADGAALYDEDVKKQAQQLGLPGW